MTEPSQMPMTGAQAAGIQPSAGVQAAPRDRATDTTPLRVTVVDFDMSFSHLVGFFVKAALAAIPAAIILFLLGMALLVAFRLAA